MKEESHLARSWPSDLKQHTNHVWQRFRQTELTILLAVALVVGGIWLFVELADEVLEGSTHALDERLLLALRDPIDANNPLGPPWVEETMRDFTALGGAGVLIFLTVGVVVYLLIQQRFRAALLVALAVIGGGLLSQLLKSGFDRPRPDLVPHGSYVYFASFPSGHSMLSAATYLTLGALLARLQTRRRLKIYVLLMALIITILVGISRIYLGVHWPTDVLAGWTAGAVWAAFCGLVMWWLQRKGEVETPVEENNTEEKHESGIGEDDERNHSG